MHQGVDLQLGLVESVRRWFDHILVDHFTYSTIQAYLEDDAMKSAGRRRSRAHLFGRENGDVILVNGSRFFFDDVRILLVLQRFTRHPEEEVFFTVFGSKEFAEVMAAS